MKVSVILPTYNRAKLLGRSIRSVLEQTFQDFELIIVDDGSTDNTREVVDSFGPEKIRYIRHPENQGPGAARNTAIARAQGEYLAFQDSDDVWFPGILERQVEALEQASPRVGVVYSRLERRYPTRTVRIPGDREAQSGDIHRAVCRGNFIALPAVLARKECFERVGAFDERLSQYEDWEMWIRVSRQYHFQFLDETLVISYVTPGSVNEKGVLSEEQAARRILARHFQEYGSDRSLLAFFYYNLGNRLCQTEFIRRGRGYLFQAIKKQPWRPDYLAAFFFSFFGPGFYRGVVGVKNRLLS